MTISIYPNQKLTTLLPSLVVTAAVLTALIFSQSAQAELVIHNSVDGKGQVKMVVTDDRQKELPPAQLGISPSRINETVSLTQNKNLGKLNQTLTLYNYGSRPKSIKLSLIDMDESGKPIDPSESTLKPWTLINPTQFTIPAGGYQTVRMSIRLPMGFANGKRLAMLSIEQQIDKSLTYDADGKGVTLEIGSRYGLPIAINVQ
ncbi:hypothetical protein [Psychrobacter sp. LFX-11D]|uniref:hypothetical protein n=1 Tax=Psychrobacter sp. LFX-11D TaxID=458201 RepID=UPI00191A7EB9|nr:hypothetical protein [Psychrobacter sp. LFX-11D]